jgi:hypothetical protein
MPIDTTLSQSPYWDDWNAAKKYYGVLYKPSFPVQTRELNQMQSILQAQIEKFGDVVLKRGTIIDGCSFAFYPNYPYAKINDTQLDGEPVNVAQFLGLFARNSANLTGYIINSQSGFESQDPNLNTIYLNYINSGNTNNLTSFSANDVLTVFDANNSIRKVLITNGGTAFSNNDPMVIIPALAVSVSSSNTFAVGEKITQATSNARAIITATSNTTIPGKIVLQIKPLLADLSNTSSNAAIWTFESGLNITGNTSSAVANVSSILGTAAAGVVVTDGLGQVSTTTMTNYGYGYNVVPYVAIKPTSNTSGLTDLNLTAQNYLCKVTVSELANSVGSGYAFGVSKGSIYQKGRFLEVDPQIVIVTKYTPTPDALSIGFDTLESIVNSNSDSTLFDNVDNENSNAPGADRLKLEPKLVVLSTTLAAANASFFPIVEFSNGNPYKQNYETAFNSIEKELALRTSEEAGDFVINPFNVAITSPSNTAHEANTFDVVVDPGTGYISGHRVSTLSNFVLHIEKGIATGTANSTIDLNYGNFLQVKELAGVFQFDTGDAISLRDTVETFVSNTAHLSSISAPGTEIGKARIRSLTYNSGQPGTSDATFNMYLFDIEMNAGQNIRNVKSVYYSNGGRTAIADTVQVYNPTVNSYITSLNGSNNTLLFDLGVASAKAANNVSYTYRKISNTTANSAGIVTLSLIPTEETFAYSQFVSNTEVLDLIAIPLTNAISNATVATSITGNTTSRIVNGAFSNTSAGDYLRLVQGSNVEVKFVTSVVNTSQVVVDSNLSYAFATGTAYLTFPQNIPVVLNNRSGRTANVDVTQKTLTLNLGVVLAANVNFNIVHNVRSVAAQVAKTVNRDKYVKLSLANNAANTIGPWTMGVADVFRLKGVWKSSNISTVNTSSTSVLNDFYIDHNQNPNYYDQSYLYLKPTSNLTLSNTDALLIGYDCFTTSANGYTTISSYSVDDNYNPSSATTVTTEEIPEVFSDNGIYYDLRNQIDFRPKVINTANVTSNLALTTINPDAPTFATRFGNTTNSANVLKIPAPSSNVSLTVTRYIGRTDRIIIDKNNKIFNVKGVPADINPICPPAVRDSITIAALNIPPFPSIPVRKSANLVVTYDKGIANERYSFTREQNHTVNIVLDNANNNIGSQTLGFNMAAIAKLERRIENLEYQVALSAQEAAIGSLTIPSSVNPQVNRFKYGFFIDDFKDISISDVKNPEYAAQVVNGRVVPPQDTTVLKYMFNYSDATTAADAVGTILTYPFEVFSIISQTTATDGPVSIIVPPAPPEPIPVPVYVPPPPEPVTPPTPISSPPPEPVYVPPAPVYVAPVVVAVAATVADAPAAPAPVAVIAPPAPVVVPVTYYYGSLEFEYDVLQGTQLIYGYLFPQTYDYGHDRVVEGDQYIHLKASGLKPNTVHTWNHESGSNVPSTPTGGNAGDPLVSDSTGSLNFSFALGSGRPQINGLTDYGNLQAQIGAFVKSGLDVWSLTSSDGTSIAYTTLKQAFVEHADADPGTWLWSTYLA